mmetsp:Transcript_30404/g.87694  ORF Transcript_30404/g.87694 Transcript_30404/m.87694 type:complete len:289 (-) Transcript_30404:365-1231(-)
MPVHGVADRILENDACDLAPVLIGAMLDQRASDVAPELMAHEPRQRCRDFFHEGPRRGRGPVRRGRGLVLEKAADDAAAVAVASDRSAHAEQFLGDEIPQLGGEKIDDKLEHVVRVRALHDLPHSAPELRRQFCRLVHPGLLQRQLHGAAPNGLERQLRDMARHSPHCGRGARRRRAAARPRAVLRGACGGNGAGPAVVQRPALGVGGRAERHRRGVVLRFPARPSAALTPSERACAARCVCWRLRGGARAPAPAAGVRLGAIVVVVRGCGGATLLRPKTSRWRLRGR